MKKLLFVLIIMTVSAVNYANDLQQILERHQGEFGLVLPEKYQCGKVHVLDISKESAEFDHVDIYSTEALLKHSKEVREQTGADLVIGRYLEDRNIYQRGKNYQAPEKEARSVHLGQDLMVPSGTPIYAPIAGKIHSFKDNNAVADYGPTLILEHNLDGITFYTLYGHLSRDAIKGLHVGQTIKKNQQIATVGKPFENGGWPEHVHFQIIDNMKGEFGNYKGVIEPSKVSEYAKHCPNPNLILNIAALK
ncbi:MAG: peptidoglycan DD-metalloendopeptidase family protein [Legionella sp.]|nr:peptidoglycan DD-metalloendopeptidase family protein [Legionella sp.]